MGNSKDSEKQKSINGVVIIIPYLHSLKIMVTTVEVDTLTDFQSFFSEEKNN